MSVDEQIEFKNKTNHYAQMMHRKKRKVVLKKDNKRKKQLMESLTEKLVGQTESLKQNLIEMSPYYMTMPSTKNRLGLLLPAKQAMPLEDTKRLIQSIVSNSPQAIFDYFHVQSAKIDMQDGQGLTLLHMATSYGRIHLVDILLRYGANPNIQTRLERYTPLHIAAKQKHTRIMNLLLDAGADEAILDYNGRTAWELVSIFHRLTA